MQPQPSISYLWLVLGVILLVLIGLVIVRLIRGARGKDVNGGCCGKCGYNVRGVSSLTCPECGSDLREVGIKQGKRDR